MIRHADFSLRRFDVVNRLARALRITISRMFAPLNETYRVQFRKRRSDAEPVDR